MREIASLESLNGPSANPVEIKQGGSYLLTVITPGTVESAFERSDDGGETWVPIIGNRLHLNCERMPIVLKQPCLLRLDLQGTGHGGSWWKLETEIADGGI